MTLVALPGYATIVLETGGWVTTQSDLADRPAYEDMKTGAMAPEAALAHMKTASEGGNGTVYVGENLFVDAGVDVPETGEDQ